ncbi:hypothetical protein [Paractinoplanes brasiliensis]|uniref:Lipoprotein n=1 Tax=Paractinoplanes brasiliensis TaxID=52695 RepID=A0A4R6JXR7_9ACTN|nr:hypothetical protein [Actinoplanes brasiliensis]TDO41167.1 hypothetical protein C8E87_4896 [Actinoplanes brasiliensis]GID26238.1 hypothetical protein Abr02nite_12210 [Actinoplanes brasiliensis]
MRPVRFGPALAALLVASLTACSAAQGTTAAPVSPSAAASASPAPSPSAPSPAPTALRPSYLDQKLAAYSTTPVIERPVIGKAVLAKYGEKRTNRTYDAVVAYLRAESWKLDRLRPKAKYTRADFASVEKPMSPHVRKAWRQELAKALKGDKEAAGELKMVALWNLGDHGFTFAPTGPYVVDERIGQPVVYLDDETKWLKINLTYSASVRMLKAGVPHRRSVSKKVTVTVYPTGDTFLLGFYDGTWGLDPDGRPE